MPRGKKLEKGQIEEIKKLKAEYPEMANVRIARFCGVSDFTVSKVLQGYYDDVPKQHKGDEDVALAMLELADRIEKQNALLGTMALALAVIIDPKSGKTSAPVADAIRSAVRGEGD